MINRYAAILCGSIAATFALTGLFNDAAAAERRYAALRCRVLSGSTGLGAAAQVWGDGATLLCPLVTGSERIGATSLAYATAYANGTTDGVTATKCFTRKTGGGGNCGTPDKRTGPGVVGLNPPAPSGGTVDDYYYLKIDLKPKVSGSFNVLFGYTETW